MKTFSVKSITGIFIIAAFFIFSANYIPYNQTPESVQNALSGGSHNSLNSVTMASILTDQPIPDDTLGFAVGDTGLVVKTTNGGALWCRIIFPSLVNLHSVSFPDFNTGWVVGDSAKIFKTTNSGLNWAVQFDSILTPLNSVFFKNTSAGWSAGEGGRILKTTNGGTAWLSQTTNTGTTKSLNCVFFPVGDTIGYIAGDSGKVLKNGITGNVWTELATGTSVNLKSAFFVSVSVGWAVGDSGKILKTTNAGINWSPLSLGSSIILRSVFFTSSLIGYVVGDNGLVRKTTDGGATWGLSNTGISTTKQLNSIVFSSVTGWTVGSNIDSNIYKTTNSAGTWALQPITCVTGITNTGNSVPVTSSLYQNYPNPFNPNTRFMIDVSRESFVKLVIYDITGRQVDMLFNDRLRPGRYEASWDGTAFSSGIYFYTVVMGDISKSGSTYFSETKKMVLLK